MKREQKITLGEMRAGGQHGFIVFCSDYRCSHNIKWRASEVDKSGQTTSGFPTLNCASSARSAAAGRPIVQRDCRARGGDWLWLKRDP